ncbi:MULTISPECIES: helix-turn-helix transcriptional regulator [unclassified Mesobacillus]|uniref:helix-turn-helix transcriptional regulator n=1 Tax=unclassified Mesobacillus TaxID=2675270 RepID=UPI00203D6C04|nr:MULTISPECIES: helix-turn-helix transcriptional regulator [unclassified Mesobacillus]MCM3123985.1 helix-turn-helix transcriptional regulator [Mesobacillus sp. MER 33]MCM3233834.1 helix-turn-helix transcriptional regulator [Mesobacillus sp. MER 48]
MQIYTPDEIASMLKISKHTVYEMIKRGDLAAFKVGNKMRIEESEFERYKTSMSATPARAQEAKGNSQHSVQLAGSHDFLVEQLVKYIASEGTGLSITPSYIGSLEGLMMLYRGSADIAAVHLLDPTSQQYNLPFIRQLFVHEPITVMRLASREQGMIVAKGNPKDITGVKDLARTDVTIVNRQKGAGTRFLLDSFLANEKLEPTNVKGYENEEWTHLGAAAHISRGTADAAFGIRCAASQLGLDFIPLTREQFDLVFRWTPGNKEALQHLIDLIQLTNFKDSIADLDGYDAEEFANIIYGNHSTEE